MLVLVVGDIIVFMKIKMNSWYFRGLMILGNNLR